MEKILYLAHTQPEGGLSKIDLEVLGAAARLHADLKGSALMIALIGEDVRQAADSIAGCGASAFYSVEGKAFGVSRYGTDALATEQLVRRSGATLVLAPATTRMARTFPGAAQRLGGCIDTRINGIVLADGRVEVQRWFYRQRLFGRLSRAHRPWFLLVDSGIAAPWQGKAGKASVEALSVEAPASCLRTKTLGFQAPSADTQTIRPDAKVLFVAGAGWTKKQADGQAHPKRAEELIRDFLSLSKASLGSSKSLVDQACEGEAALSFMSHLNQVGQTGSSPRHPKGLATCCHGEEPHVVGWRFINERRAVNKDPNCGWAQGKTDVLYVADAFEVMEKVNALLK